MGGCKYGAEETCASAEHRLRQLAQAQIVACSSRLHWCDGACVCVCAVASSPCVVTAPCAVCTYCRWNSMSKCHDTGLVMPIGLVTGPLDHVG